MKKCPNCGVQMADDSLFCTNCGSKVPQTNTCPHCGVQIADGSRFCTGCGKSILQNDTCPHCGAEIADGCCFCTECGKECVQDSSASFEVKQSPEQDVTGFNNENHVAQHNFSPPSSYSPVAPVPDFSNEGGKSNGILIAAIILLAVILCGAGGYLYYENIYLPEKIDREAPRYYTMANVVVLRSSRSAGADFNKVASLPYGTELITYEHDSEWARVKVNFPSGEKQEGYIASPYILEKKDFFLLNSIFGNQDSKETIITTKCRMALLNYYKDHHYIGKIDEQVRTDAGITVVPNGENQWQVFCKPKDAKPNSVLFKRLYSKNSQFTDFAVIITNVVSGDRKLLYFYFDEDETPHLLTEQEAPSQGYIVDATYGYDYYYGSRELNVYYSN